MKTKEQLAVDEMMAMIYTKAYPFNTPDSGVIRWTLQDFTSSPNGQKLARALASLVDPSCCDTKYEDF